MKTIIGVLLALCATAAMAVERSLDKETRVTLHHTGWGDGDEWDKAYAYFDRAWTNVLANLKKRFETGPYDWSEWMKQLRQMQEKAGQK